MDLRNGYLGSASDSDGDDWIYFGWERDANNGSGFISFEFMKNPPPAACGDYTASQATLIANCNPWANRTAGDFMIFWDQQGGSKDLYLRTWSGTAPNLTLSDPTLLNSNVSDAEYSADGFFGEGALNLTDTVFGGSNACRSFANVIPSTVTGNSDSADYKDTILQPITPIGNCTSTTVTTPKLGDGTTNVPADGTSITTAGVVPGQGLGRRRHPGRHFHPGRLGLVPPVQGQLARPLRLRRHGYRKHQPERDRLPRHGGLSDGLRYLGRPVLLARRVQWRLRQQHQRLQ